MLRSLNWSFAFRFPKKCYAMLEYIYILPMIITCQSCLMGNFTPNIGFSLYILQMFDRIKIEIEIEN